MPRDKVFKDVDFFNFIKCIVLEEAEYVKIIDLV